MDKLECQRAEENDRPKKVVAQQALDSDTSKESAVSERHACELTGMHRGNWRYQRKERNEIACGFGCGSWQRRPMSSP